MNYNPLLCITCFISLLILRAYMGLIIPIALSKKERKEYLLSTSPIDRWFFWSAPKYVKDKYNKFEKRNIPYIIILKVYRTLTVTLHLLLVIFLIIMVLTFFAIIPTEAIDFLCGIYLVFSVLVLIVLFVIELSTNKRYHRSRYK